MIALLHAAMVYYPTIQLFALVMVPVLVLINASVTVDGWEVIARSLIASVSHPIIQMFVLATETVSDTTSVVAIIAHTVGTCVTDLQRNERLSWLPTVNETLVSQ